MDKGAGFWIPLAGVCLVVIALGVLASGLSMGRSASDEAWNRLALAKDSADRVKVAEEFPDTPAARWALLQAATETYNKGFRDLPANREAAEPLLRKARTQFEQVVKQSPKDSPQARIAALGVARSLEAHNDLDKAIEQYEYVAKTWPESPEAKHAERLAQALRKPENVAFYKELYAYKPIEATIPPMGTQGFTLPSNPGTGGLTLPPNHPPVDGPTIPAGSFLPPPPPPSLTGHLRDDARERLAPGHPPARERLLPGGPHPEGRARRPKAEETPATGPPAGTPLPGDVFTPETPAPKAEPEAGGDARARLAHGRPPAGGRLHPGDPVGGGQGRGDAETLRRPAPAIARPCPPPSCRARPATSTSRPGWWASGSTRTWPAATPTTRGA